MFYLFLKTNHTSVTLLCIRTYLKNKNRENQKNKKISPMYLTTSDSVTTLANTFNRR
jgi:hypothetical protein